MTTKDILTLANAGFTAQQIAALGAVKQTGENTSPAMLTIPQGSNLAEMNKQIEQLTQAVQLGNVLASNQPPAETVDDILTSIINPPNITGGENK